MDGSHTFNAMQTSLNSVCTFAKPRMLNCLKRRVRLNSTVGRFDDPFTFAILCVSRHAFDAKKQDLDRSATLSGN